MFFYKMLWVSKGALKGVTSCFEIYLSFYLLNFVLYRSQFLITSRFSLLETLLCQAFLDWTQYFQDRTQKVTAATFLTSDTSFATAIRSILFHGLNFVEDPWVVREHDEVSSAEFWDYLTAVLQALRLEACSTD